MSLSQCLVVARVVQVVASVVALVTEVNVSDKWYMLQSFDVFDARPVHALSCPALALARPVHTLSCPVLAL